MSVKMLIIFLKYVSDTETKYINNITHKSDIKMCQLYLDDPMTLHAVVSERVVDAELRVHS